MLHLDQPSNELNIKRGQSRFEAALRQDANYARAHAGLCLTLLEEYWMSDEERALKDAGRACGQALQLDPEDPVVSSAHALFLRRTGRNDDAMAVYEKIVDRFPSYSSVRAGLAASYLDAYRQSGDAELLARAKEAARKAADTDPQTWKPLFALSTMEWFDGNVAGAIAASEEALLRDRNEYLAANLGTFYLCDGAFHDAIESYTLAQELAPGSYVGDEFLGLAHYFLGNFEDSLRLRRRAIEAISTGEPELHEMWGNLGDSYRQLGANADAVAAYLKAAEIAERDHLRGTAPAADRVARAYYYMRLKLLDPTLVPGAVEDSIAADLDEIDTSIVASSAHRRMAEVRLMRGEYEKARSSLERASQTCKGYGMLPDLAPLTQVPDAS
jgi:tetratricopeptide (TPR) repeat protein